MGVLAPMRGARRRPRLSGKRSGALPPARLAGYIEASSWYVIMRDLLSIPALECGAT